MVKISGTVGHGGQNHRADVLTVQRLINAKLPIGVAPLVEDGVCGPKTFYAIEQYQRQNLHMKHPGRIIDPFGPIFLSLIAAVLTAAAQAVARLAANPVNNAMNYFIGQGWTPAQAAGIVANLQAESGLRPDAVGDRGLAYGIAQWHPDRQANFKKLFTHQAIQGSTLDQQLRFVQWELSNTERYAAQRLRTAKSAYDAGAFVSEYYERPADRAGAATRRGNLAKQIYTAFTNGH
jgi:hypothetical protein